MDITVPVDWAPRPYQLPLWSYLEGGGKRAVAVWHRRAGKDATALNWTVVSALQRVGLYWHLLPTYNQGRKIMWDGKTKEGRAFLEAWPEGFIAGRNNTDMRLELKNGSLWQVVGTDNVDRLVGANPVGCVFSEYSLQDARAWDYIRPILTENGGWALFIYTPRGMNHGYTLYEMAKKNPNWFCEKLTINETKAIGEEDIQLEKDSGMSDDMINQEYYCSFLVVGSRPFNFSDMAPPRGHVIPPRDIPLSAPIYMGFDWGFGHPFAVVWAWTDGDGRIYQFNEWYGWNGKPNEGLRLEDSVIAQGIKSREQQMGIEGRTIIRLAGHDCFQKKPDYRGGGQGPSTAEVFAANGVFLTVGDPSRELKLRQFRERLRVFDDQAPMLLVYRTCEQTIRTLPLIKTADNNLEDVDMNGETHIYDALCLIAMARPIAAAGPRKKISLTDRLIERVESVTVDSNEMELMVNSAVEHKIWDGLISSDEALLLGFEDFKERKEPYYDFT